MCSFIIIILNTHHFNFQSAKIEVSPIHHIFSEFCQCPFYSKQHEEPSQNILGLFDGVMIQKNPYKLVAGMFQGYTICNPPRQATGFCNRLVHLSLRSGSDESNMVASASLREALYLMYYKVPLSSHKTRFYLINNKIRDIITIHTLCIMQQI